jgi:hypothetical protein
VIDFPGNAQVATQFGEHFRVEVLDTLQRVGSEAVGFLEMLVALGPSFRRARGAGKQASQQSRTTAGLRATADLSERTAIVGG